MTCIINASTTNNLQISSDGSGIVKVQSNGVTTNALAWVSYNASTQTIRASYNISSVTYTSTGIFTVNLTTATTDTNYVICGTFNHPASNAIAFSENSSVTRTTSAFGIVSLDAGSYYNPTYLSVAIFGN